MIPSRLSFIERGLYLLDVPIRIDEGAFVVGAKIFALGLIEEEPGLRVKLFWDDQKRRILLVEVEIADMPPLTLPFIEIFGRALLSWLIDEGSDFPDRIIFVVPRMRDQVPKRLCMRRVFVRIHDWATIAGDNELLPRPNPVAAALVG